MSNVCQLQDGRELGYARYGNEDGPQIFHLHGLSGCRLEGRCFYERHLDKLGAGLISVERAGIGLSSPHPGSTVSDHARDVLQLARHLGLKEWWVVAVSGGSPYALACARHHPPESLQGLAICAGVGPYSHGYQGMGFGTRMMLLMFRFCPWLCHIVYRPIFALQNWVSNEKLVEMLQRNSQKPNKLMQIQEKDVELFQNRELQLSIMACIKEHFRQGFSCFVQDGQRIANDWDFRMEDITFRPIHLWHGK